MSIFNDNHKENAEEKNTHLKFKLIKRYDIDTDEIFESNVDTLDILPWGVTGDKSYHASMHATIELSQKNDNQFFPAHQTYR